MNKGSKTTKSFRRENWRRSEAWSGGKEDDSFYGEKAKNEWMTFIRPKDSLKSTKSCLSIWTFISDFGKWSLNPYLEKARSGLLQTHIRTNPRRRYIKSQIVRRERREAQLFHSDETRRIDPKGVVFGQ